MKKVISSILTCTMVLSSIGGLSCFASAANLESEETESAVICEEDFDANSEDSSSEFDADADDEEDTDSEPANGSRSSILKVVGCVAGASIVAAGAYFGYTNRQEIATYAQETAGPAIKSFALETAFPASKSFVTETVPNVTKLVCGFIYKHAGKMLGVAGSSLTASKNIFCSDSNYPGICSSASNAKNTVSNWFTSGNTTVTTVTPDNATVNS
ncbi:MAG: hypothetical protein RUMPE_00355 [Eubacteriales bacterium SKADARSKE-1]|nr:hypothetical protein [Eubacteriales bacterium SKADARSKE-1]